MAQRRLTFELVNFTDEHGRSRFQVKCLDEEGDEDDSPFEVVEDEPDLTPAFKSFLMPAMVLLEKQGGGRAFVFGELD